MISEYVTSYPPSATTVNEIEKAPLAGGVAPDILAKLISTVLVLAVFEADGFV